MTQAMILKNGSKRSFKFYWNISCSNKTKNKSFDLIFRRLVLARFRLLPFPVPLSLFLLHLELRFLLYAGRPLALEPLDGLRRLLLEAGQRVHAFLLPLLGHGLITRLAELLSLDGSQDAAVKVSGYPEK